MKDTIHVKIDWKGKKHAALVGLRDNAAFVALGGKASVGGVDRKVRIPKSDEARYITVILAFRDTLEGIDGTISLNGGPAEKLIGDASGKDAWLGHAWVSP